MLDGIFMMAPPVFMGNSRIGFWSGFAGIAEKLMGYKEIRKV